MERFLRRHTSRILGSISGFDRMVFRGVLRSISYVQGLDYFMGSQRVGFKDFRGFVEKFSAGIKVRAEQIAQQAKRPFLYVASGQASKEALVRKVLEEKPVKEGLICVLSCVEPCQTFTVRRERESRQLRLVPRDAKCLHLYFYFLDRNFGLMHLRLQTWRAGAGRAQPCDLGRIRPGGPWARRTSLAESQSGSWTRAIGRERSPAFS